MDRNRPKPDSQDQVIEATAAAWLAQRDDHLTASEAAAFARWRQANPRHEAAVQRLEKTWSTLQQLQELRKDSRTRPNRDVLARPCKTRLLPFPAPATAAVLAACLTLAAVWWASSATTPSAAPGLHDSSYTTAADGYRRVTLPDGSVVALNANSEVRVNYTVRERRVRLLRGEANFIVAKNKARPFWVTAGKISVRAVGTAFNVRLGSREVEVLVTEGKVKVKTEQEGRPQAEPDQPQAKSPTPSAHTYSYLVAGQRLRFSEQSPATSTHIDSLSSQTIRKSLAWQGARLRFVDTPLADVAAQFNRRNHVQIELADPSLATLPVDGSFCAENVETFVRLLESNGTIRAQRLGRDRIVLHQSR